MNDKVETKPLMVTIRCLVYNHEPYLRKCLEGFVMQKTNFRFNAIVHDDCSKDGSVAIIREYAEKYPDIIIPIIEKENLWSKNDDTLGIVMKKASGDSKYVAWCEGDDFWTDPYKLQKQFDALENNPEASFVYTGFRLVDKKNNEVEDATFDRLMGRSKSGIAFFDLLVNMNKIMTLTFMAKQIVNQTYPPSYYDYGTFLVAARMGKCIYLPDITSSYRINPTSIIRTAKHTLTKPFFTITYDQVKAIIDGDANTADIINNHPMKKTVIGYVICRNLKNNKINKKDFLKLVIRHPEWYYYVVKGFFIRLFALDSFCNKVANI